MALIFIVCFLVWGWLEILVFTIISDEIGGLMTLFGVFLTAIIGISFLKNQGLSALNRARNDLIKGQPPVASIAESISLVLGGGLMLIPGYVTDSFGLLLFIPGFRAMAGMYLLKSAAKKPNFIGFVNFGESTFTRGNGNQDPFGFSEQSHYQNNFDDVIEGEFEERPDGKLHDNQKNEERRSDC